MSTKKQFATHKAFTVLLLTIIVFSAGIMIGNHNTAKKYTEVLDMSEQLSLRTQSAEVEYAILENNICAEDENLFLTDDLIELATRLDYMENQLGWDNPRIQQLKEQYFIVEAKHWLLSEKRLETCLDEPRTMNNTIILYFYSNQGDCQKCAEQGSVLSYLRNDYQGMKIYSFDINSDTPAVSTIKGLYGLIGAEMPTLVINNEVLQGFSNANEVVNFVEKQTSSQQLVVEN